MMVLLIIWMIMVTALTIYAISNIIKDINVINDPKKWTNMEIIESSMYPGEKVIAFWNGLDLKDSFYIDEKGHPVNHAKN